MNSLSARASWRRVTARSLGASAFFLLTMCADPLGPSSGHGRAVLAFAPTFSNVTAGSSNLTLDNVRIAIRGADSLAVVDTIIVFPANADEVSLDLSVPVHGDQETFAVTLGLRAGAQLFFEGTKRVDVRAGARSASPTAIPVSYVGPGANAARAEIMQHDVLLSTGQSQTLTLAVYDSAGNHLSSIPPVQWSSTDSSVATVSQDGVAFGMQKRGTATIIARLMSGLVVQSTVRLIPPAASVQALSTAARTGRAGLDLAGNFVVEVDGPDGLGVPGVTVDFRALTAGSVTPSSIVTDETGIARATVTLGGTLGMQTFEATVDGVGSTSLDVTVSAGLPAAIALASGNAQSDFALSVLDTPLGVRVRDTFGNAVRNATVTWQRTTGSGSLSTNTSLTDSTGLATVSYTLGAAAGQENVKASIQSGANVTFALTTKARLGVTIEAISPRSQTGTAGSRTQPISVRVVDGSGKPVPDAVVVWTSDGAADIDAEKVPTDANGVATIRAVFGTIVGKSIVTASAGGNDAIDFTLISVAPLPVRLSIIAGNVQTSLAGSVVRSAPTVLVSDADGKPVAGALVSFVVLTGGGSVDGSTAVSNDAGIASAGAWTLGPAGPQTLMASTGDVSVIFAATSIPAGSPRLGVVADASGLLVNGTAFATQPVIQLMDGSGAPLAKAGIPVSVRLAEKSQELSGTATIMTDASGKATFRDLLVTGIVGKNALVFSAPDFDDASISFELTVGLPKSISPATPVALTVLVGTGVTAPAIVVRDVSGNPVPGIDVEFATGRFGFVLNEKAVTNSAGVASSGSWIVGALIGVDSVIASVAGSRDIEGNPVVFTATATAGSASDLVLISGNNQTVTVGGSSSPMVVEARDRFGNAVVGVPITFTEGANSSTVETDEKGRASYVIARSLLGITTVKACLPGCTASVSFTTISILGGVSGGSTP